MKHVKMRVTPAPAASGSTSSRCRTVASYVSLCRRLWLRPDGRQEQPYRDSHGNFEESMNGDHPCWLGTDYEHDDG